MIELREEAASEDEEIDDIVRRAFDGEDEVSLIHRIRKSPNYIPELSLIALHNQSTPVGYIMFSKITIETDDETLPSLALAPVSVVPELQNEGIGSMMIRDGLMRATALGYRHVVVLGDNRYYSRFGFVPASEKNVTGPFDDAGDAFMVKELKKDALKKGHVRYPTSFGI
ncbi:GNAT family N-acetyltransferase [Guptibacillus algicola]|uniref:GNAT family N-acetyltransferase n=1 Tax=Guptibacillus algicola TaxID=225844 RepID=UPI001CD26D4C|nr:N-acetyltransferase [Alkalihalobacillus algicola]MCA0988880.1 N-acetyltransferase [Alkalihalobacillus algicola]